MFNQQLSQQNDSVYQQLNEVVQQLNTSINVLNALVEEVHQLNSSTNIKLSQQYAVINSLYQQLRQLDNRTLQLKASLLNGPSPGHFPFYLLDSCAALPPSSPSGYYWVRASNGSAVSVYCDMIKSCGGVTGGWMRVAELDMTNSSHQCPSGLMERIYSDKRTCVRIETAGGCSSANNFITPGVKYSNVCGRVIGYQYGSTDAFIGGTSADSRYVDGVSLTHGHPRRHIWTFAAAQDEVGSFNCAALPPSSPSGYYWVRASNGSAVSVYCDMTRSCGGVTGGWMRVAELDMTNSNHQCPSGLMERIYSGKRTCVRIETAGGCLSVHFITPVFQRMWTCHRLPIWVN